MKNFIDGDTSAMMQGQSKTQQPCNNLVVEDYTDFAR